jgi:hypothetical protein
VDASHAPTVSGYFTRLAEHEPDWAAGRTVAAELIEQAGGISEEDRAWARATLGRRCQPRPWHDDPGS